MIKNGIFCPEVETDNTLSEPLHLQLSKAIRNQIRRCRPSSEVRLLSERKMSEILNVDRSTVHRAYVELIDDGVIESRTGKKGLFITCEAHEKLKKPFPVIGVIVPEKFSDFVSKDIPIRLGYINGIIDHASELECSTMMIQLPSLDKDREAVDKWMTNVIDRLDGAIHLGDRYTGDDYALESLLGNSVVPQIFISGHSKFKNTGVVVGDVRPGALAAAQLLWENGHRNVGTVSCFSPKNTSTNRLCEYEVVSRLAWVVECFEEYKLNISPDWQLFNCDTVKAISEKLKHIFSGKNKPTAFWCINDNIAMKTVEALSSLGLNVPDDVSIIGYDDISPREETIPLTSIKLPFYSIGCRAVDMLMDYYEGTGKISGKIVKLPTSLVIRESVSRVNS